MEFLRLANLHLNGGSAEVEDSDHVRDDSGTGDLSIDHYDSPFVST